MARGPRTQSGFPTVAVLRKRGKLFEAEPAFGDEPSVLVGRKSLNGARSGELVVLKPAGRGRGEVVRRLGKADSLPAIMEGVLAYHRIPRGFSRKAEAEAEAGSGLAAAADPGRRDLTGLDTFTIDPDEARDFDDAISLVDGPSEGEITLYVHIADVSYFVAPGSTLDRRASRKGCSVYLPIAVEPMLPAALSSDACSLRPHEDRKCLTVEMTYKLGDTILFSSREKRAREPDRKKEVESPGAPPTLTKTSFCRSTIRSRQRLTYNQVDDLFGVPEADSPAAYEGRLDAVERRGTESIGPQTRALLERCRRLAAALRQARHERGALNITTFEPEFRIGEDGEVLSVRARPESESHALIEEFMIAANEAVAGFLEHRQGDCIYRVHEEPDAMAVDALFDMLEDLGVPTPPFSLETGSPQKAAVAIRHLISSLPRVLSEQQRSRTAFGEIVLRSLKQARYYEENLGHFGLASPAYLHFTSPIRRYPDLVVHRALLKELHLEEHSCSRLELAATAESSSEAERRAAMVEHAGDDIVLAFLLDRLLFDEGWDRRFEGEVISLINSGLFVRFEHVYEGFVPARRLWGDYFSLSDSGGALVGRRSGRAYKLGDRITVRVVRIDKLKGKVELEPAV